LTWLDTAERTGLPGQLLGRLLGSAWLGWRPGERLAGRTRTLPSESLSGSSLPRNSLPSETLPSETLPSEILPSLSLAS